QTADTEVAEERLRRDVAELDLLLETGLAELVRNVEQVLVRSSETSRALGGADHDVSGVVEKLAPPFPGVDRVVESRDRVRVSFTQAGYGIEVVAVSGRDDQVVVVVGPSRRVDPLVY